ncbi:MAG: hypothetical protein AAB526_03285, partial [Patescibacteria group bacterium]
MDFAKGEKIKKQKKFSIFKENIEVFLFSKKVCILLILMAGFFYFSFIPQTQAIPFPVDSKEVIKTFWGNIIETVENVKSNLMGAQKQPEQEKKIEESPVVVPSETVNEPQKTEKKGIINGIKDFLSPKTETKKEELPAVIPSETVNEPQKTEKKSIINGIKDLFTSPKKEEKPSVSEELIPQIEKLEGVINLGHRGDVINLNQDG